MTITVLVNPGGGTAGGDAPDKLRDALGAAGLDVAVEKVEGGHLQDRARALRAAGAPLVIAAGGDGTISAVAGALAGSDTALGVMPLGTLNHFARDLGIPFDLDRAAAIIAEGQQQKVDVADLDGRIFINNSAIGLYPLMVVDREAQQKRLGRSKRLAMLVASIRTLLRFHHRRLSLRINETERAVLDTPLLFVGNNDYKLEFPAAGSRSSLVDGRLCVLVMRKKGRLGFLAATMRALVGWTRPDDMIRLDDVQTLDVSSHRATLILSCDGETLCLQTPIRFQVRPGALRVMVPTHTPVAIG